MMENGVSIIIPTCNGGRLFEECLAAIKLQDYEGPLQLIIIDSDSTDKTVELAMTAGHWSKELIHNSSTMPGPEIRPYCWQTMK